MTDSLLGAARIFVVDDQEANVRLLQQILTRAGFTNLRLFTDGPTMLAAIESDDPDLILLDLHMPGMDGFAVLEALQARRDDDAYLPVLVLTADAERWSRTHALASGARDFLAKPFDTGEAVLRVRNLVETRLLHRALKARTVDLAGEVAVRTEQLQASESHWSAVSASLGRLAALETPEATADAICGELATLPDVDAISIVAFGAGDTAVTLARRADADAGPRVIRPLTREWSRRVREMAAGGTWFGPRTALDPDVDATSGSDLTAVAVLPLRTTGTLIGALIAGTREASGVAQLAHRLPTLEAFAALAGALLAPGILERQHDGELRVRISDIITGSAFFPVYQPIVDIATGAVVGHEALTRFADGTRPDRMFTDAAAVGLGPSLESACLTAALLGAGSMPPGRWLSLNVSPGLVLAGRRLQDVLGGASVPVVLEITEHVPIADYPAFRAAIGALGATVQFAIDDAGAGFASFRHIVELRPDFVKLDLGLVRSIERDLGRQALIAGMVHFAAQTGCDLIAEGIETDEELQALRALGVGLGQGYLLGRPQTMREAAAWPTGAAVVAP